MANDLESEPFAAYLRRLAILILAAATGCVAMFAIEDRRDRAMMKEMDASQSELLSLEAQITSIKDANLTTPNDFIAAYAQVEPLEKEYDQKLDHYNKLYNAMHERDAHRSLFDLQRYRGTHHPKSWEKMSEIIGLVLQINDLTKHEISIVHAMASLPESDRSRFWHDQFLPLATEEHALREQLRAVGEGETNDSTMQ